MMWSFWVLSWNESFQIYFGFSCSSPYPHLQLPRNNSSTVHILIWTFMIHVIILQHNAYQIRDCYFLSSGEELLGVGLLVALSVCLWKILTSFDIEVSWVNQHLKSFICSTLYGKCRGNLPGKGNTKVINNSFSKD